MKKNTNDIEDIEKRISVLKKQSNTENKSDISQSVVGYNIAIELVSATIVGAAIGYTLDEIFDIDSLLLILFTIMGGIAGMLNIQRYLNSEKTKGEK